MCRGLFCCSAVCVGCDGVHPLQYWWCSQFGAVVNGAAKHIAASVRCARGGPAGPGLCRLW